MGSILERPYLYFGLAYGVLGMSLGIHMAATHNHGQLVTHAHLLLVGFLLSTLYAVMHRLWLEHPNRILAGLQFLAHHFGTVVLISALFLLYGNIYPLDVLEPVLASASLVVLGALVLMAYMIVRYPKRDT